MKAIELCADYNGNGFRVGRSKIVWETVSYNNRSGKVYISRVVTDGTGKPFLLGLTYKSRYIHPNTIVHPIETEK